MKEMTEPRKISFYRPRKTPLFDILKNDVELQKLKEQWKEVFPTNEFPPYHYDFYSGIDDYKRKIKEAIETGDESKSGGVIKSVDLVHQK